MEVCFLHIVLMKYFEFYWTVGFRIYMTLVLIIVARLFHTVLYTHGILFEKCQHSTYILFNLDLAIAPELTRGSSGIMDNVCPWWRHQMETFSALLAICAGNSPVPGEFPTQRPVTRSFDVYFHLRPDKRLSKQSWGWWFETLSHSLWRHRNALLIMT